MDYAAYQEIKEREFETMCRRCGKCCGRDEDPCGHLKRSSEGKFQCDIYGTRFGKQRTVSGREFNCVSVRELMETGWPRLWDCAYSRR